MATKIDVGGELHPITTEGVLADASVIKDRTQNKTQEELNSEVQESLSGKQAALTAGAGVKIEGNTISHNLEAADSSITLDEVGGKLRIAGNTGQASDVTSAVGVSFDSTGTSIANIDTVDGALRVLAGGYKFLGEATTETSPANPGGKSYYLATEAGIYRNFNNLSVLSGEVALLVFDGTAWSKVVSGAASKEEVSQLRQELDEFVTDDGDGTSDDFHIADLNGKAIVKFSGGHIATKNFNSATVVKSLAVSGKTLIITI